MYLSVTTKTFKTAVIHDEGWPKIEINGHRWERLDPGVWQHINSGKKAVRQVNNTWLYGRAKYKDIKKLMLTKSTNRTK